MGRTKHAPMTRRQRTVLAITMIAGFMAPFMSTALSLAITDISAELDCGATTATWVINAYTLCTAACSMPFGHLADVKGRKPFLLLGTAGFFAFSVVCVLATNVYVLIAARAGMSISASAFLAATIPMAITCFPPHEKGRALGIAVIATYLGIALGPVIGGIITEHLGWRWIFMTGIVLVATPVLQILFSPYAGRLSDRIASYKVATAGMIVITASLVILSFLTPDMPLWLVVAALAVLGLGNAFFGTPNNNAILSCVDRSSYSEASSSINTMRGIGQSLSVAMVSLVFALTIGNTVFVQTDPAQLADAIRIIMVLSLAVSVLATVISFASGRRGGKR